MYKVDRLPSYRNISIPQTSCSSSSPHEYWGMNACRESREGGRRQGQREKGRIVKEERRGGWADIVRGLAVRRLSESWAGCLLIGKQRAVGGQIRVAVG